MNQGFTKIVAAVVFIVIILGASWWYLNNSSPTSISSEYSTLQENTNTTVQHPATYAQPRPTQQQTQLPAQTTPAPTTLSFKLLGEYEDAKAAGSVTVAGTQGQEVCLSSINLAGAWVVQSDILYTYTFNSYCPLTAEQKATLAALSPQSSSQTLQGEKMYTQQKYGYSFSYPSSVYVQEDRSLYTQSNSLRLSDGKTVTNTVIRCGTTVSEPFYLVKQEEASHSGHIVKYYRGGGYENYGPDAGEAKSSATAIICNNQNTFCLGIQSKSGAADAFQAAHNDLKQFVSRIATNPVFDSVQCFNDGPRG